MYQQLYNLGIKAYGAAIGVAGNFNDKARRWKEGRHHLFEKLKAEIPENTSILWFHAASLGEAEQAVPVMQKLKVQFPEKKLMLTFFSPSGMEHFKNNGLADYLFYLPLDTPKNARQFLDIIKPELAFFIKYEIWPNFFKEIQERKIPLIIAPAIFRKDQFYFKPPHIQFFLPILKKVNRILVQDENSKTVLQENGITQVQVCGDSRFDRVKQNVKMPFDSPLLKAFCKEENILIGGSTWQPDEEILKAILDRNPYLKMIIAPHDIQPENIARVSKLFGTEHSFRYSEPPKNPEEKRVCIIDNIGLLSRLYRYGNMAYIGGAFGKGVHNSLEAAAYGLPLFFGPNHYNFIEPKEMMQEGFAFEINNSKEMQKVISSLLTDKNTLRALSIKAEKYVAHKAGAVDSIVEEVKNLLE